MEIEKIKGRKVISKHRVIKHKLFTANECVMWQILFSFG